MRNRFLHLPVHTICFYTLKKQKAKYSSKLDLLHAPANHLLLSEIRKKLPLILHTWNRGGCAFPVRVHLLMLALPVLCLVLSYSWARDYWFPGFIAGSDYSLRSQWVTRGMICRCSAIWKIVRGQHNLDWLVLPMWFKTEGVHLEVAAQAYAFLPVTPGIKLLFYGTENLQSPFIQQEHWVLEG